MNAARTVGDLPGRAAMLWEKRVALVQGEIRLSFEELSLQVDRAAKALIALGVRPGERIALWLLNRPEWVVMFFAAARVGAVVVPLNTRYRIDDLRHALQHSGAVLLLLQDRSGPVRYAELLQAAGTWPEGGHGAGSRRFDRLRQVVMLGEVTSGSLGWSEFLASSSTVSSAELADRASAVETSSPFLVVYTSGTTGLPKGVLHTHACLRSVHDRMLRFKVSAADVNINYLPLFHLYGLSEGCMMSVMAGARQVLLAGFSAPEVLAAIETERGTLLHGFDVHYGDLLREQRVRPRETSSLRLATYPAGQPQSASIARAVQLAFCPTVSGYGMTETWAFCACSEPEASPEQRCSASGTAMPGIELRIRADDCAGAVPVGSEGLLEIRGYAVTPGYLDDPAATQEAFASDGWFKTGDRAKIERDGQLVFLGRQSDVLKVGGENVAPAEIEAMLMGMDGVEIAAVVGEPDARLGQVPVAFVVPKAGSKNIDGDRLLGGLKGRIASFKIPRRVMIVESLPTTASGKLQKFKLREMLHGKLAQAIRVQTPSTQAANPAGLHGKQG